MKNNNRQTGIIPQKASLFSLTLAAIGVVFGDIGTSPLYALRECFHGEYSIAVNDLNILGVLSLIFWALIMIVCLKYLIFIMKADDHGEGGIMVLVALLRATKINKSPLKKFVFTIGLFGACLLYGDSMITPAISVLSAIEGMRIITPTLKPYIIPVTVTILICLFSLQSRGTARVGKLFGPVMLVWFMVIAALGTVQIVHNPHVLAAISPVYAIKFLIYNKIHGFIILGAVFLVVTGAEALYADIGHFGKAPIRTGWFTVIFPSLVLNYFGQGAVLLSRPHMSHHPFYALVPSIAVVPMVIFATMATIIASQAVITGAFSLTSQAINLGYLPRLDIKYTSASQMGQIYIPIVNWFLLVCAIFLVIGFQTSSKIAAAYGVAVTLCMLITTFLFHVLMSKVWKWNLLFVWTLTTVFFVIDATFFSANIAKLFHGAWFPLAVATCFFIIMSTWKYGTTILRDEIKKRILTFDDFSSKLKKLSVVRVPGLAVYMTRTHNVVPVALLHNLKHNKVLHSHTVFLTIRMEEIPRIPNFEKIEIIKYGNGFYQIIAHYGFMEQPKVRRIFELAREKGLSFLKPEEASFFIGRERLHLSPKPKMARWRSNLYIFLSKIQMDVSSGFGLPIDNVIEIGVPLDI